MRPPGLPLVTVLRSRTFSPAIRESELLVPELENTVLRNSEFESLELSMAAQRLVKLSSASGEIFEVDEAVALQSQFVRNVIEDVGVGSPIPLPNVSSHILRQVLGCCKCCVQNAAKFVKVDMENLYDLIMAADYMHIETLLHVIYHTLAMMIAKKTFGEIRQIFNSTNDLARGEGGSIGKESQILASLMESLPTELQLKIKIEIGQRFHHGEWSPWRYDVDAQMLYVELANLYDPYNMHQQIAIILLHIDIGLVNTLVLQTCGMLDPMDMDVFKDLMDGIDLRMEMLKMEHVLYDDEETMN